MPFVNEQGEWEHVPGEWVTTCFRCQKQTEDTVRVINLCDQCIKDGGPPGWEIP